MTLLVVTGLKAEAQIAAGPGLAVVVGGGDAGLDRRLEQAMAAHRPSALLSFGVAGALDPALAVGDGVAATEVRADGWTLPCDMVWAAALAAATGLRAAPAAASGKAADTVEAKRTLRRETGAAVLDMESHTVALAARAAGLPFAVLRVVSDTAGHALPAAALAGWGPDGGMDVGAVLAALARRPAELPALVRTGREFGRALRVLRAARAAAGPRFALQG